MTYFDIQRDQRKSQKYRKKAEKKLKKKKERIIILINNSIYNLTFNNKTIEYIF